MPNRPPKELLGGPTLLAQVLEGLLKGAGLLLEPVRSGVHHELGVEITTTPAGWRTTTHAGPSNLNLVSLVENAVNGSASKRTGSRYSLVTLGSRTIEAARPETIRTLKSHKGVNAEERGAGGNR